MDQVESDHREAVATATSPTTAPEILSLAEAAERLGVHYVTAYRYVRHGLLEAHQEGRRWCVTSEDLQGFAARSRASSAAEMVPVDFDLLLNTLAAGDEATAWKLLEQAGATSDPVVAQEEYIAPVLREIGRRWSLGEATIAQEHLATTVASRLIARLGTPTRRGRRLAKVLVGCPLGDTHALTTSFFANLLRAEGAEVIDLGQVATADEFLSQIRPESDPVGVAITCTMPHDRPFVASLASDLRHSDAIGCIAIGGMAVPDRALAESLGSDIYEDTARDAAHALIKHLRGH